MDAKNARPAVSSASLVLPFAVLGLIGGWLAADAFKLGEGVAIRWILTIITPLVAAGLGAFLAARLDRGPLTTTFVILGATATAGIVNGVLVGFFVAPPVGMILGLVFGMICCLPFVPAILLVAFTARRVGRARLLSMVDRADRRAVWVATWVVVALAAALPVPSITVYGPGSAVFPLVAGLFLIALLACDLDAYLRARALRARIALARTASGDLDEALPTIDFGLGDDVVEEIGKPGAVYRGRDRTLGVFHGSADRARTALRWAIAVDFMALLIVAACALHRAPDLLQIPAGLTPPGSGNDWI